MDSSSLSKAPPQQQRQRQQQQAAGLSVQQPAPHGRVRFDRRMLLVYGLLLLDVVVIGITSLQHVWQPANLIDKVLQNHSTPMHAEDQHQHLSPQLQLPVAVKRELGMSCCCGWLALAVMGIFSLLVSYTPSSVVGSKSSPAPSSTFTAVEGRKTQNAVSTRRSRTSSTPPEGHGDCGACARIADEVELQIKLKFLLVAIASFCVFFGLNLIVQIHGRFQQSKVTVAALKTFAANSNTAVPPIDRPSDLYGLGHSEYRDFPLQEEGNQRGTGAFSSASVSKQNAGLFAGEQQQSSGAPLYGQGDEGPVHQQSPPYFYWRDFFFWTELSRECLLDGEIQLSSLWVVLHAAALLGGRGFFRSRSAVHVAAD